MHSPELKSRNVGNRKYLETRFLEFQRPAFADSTLPISRLELSRVAADAFACCGADGRGDLS